MLFESLMAVEFPRCVALIIGIESSGPNHWIERDRQSVTAVTGGCSML